MQLPSQRPGYGVPPAFQAFAAAVAVSSVVALGA